MRKFIKYLLSTLVALVVIAAAGIGILIFTVNPNHFKDPILQQAEKVTGRTITINGDIKWSIYPWLGLNVQQVNIANPPTFADKPFATLDEADIKLKLTPLLSGKFELGKLVLHGLTLNLITTSDGKNNWDDLGKTATTNKPIPNSDTNQANAHKVLALTLSGIDIADANIHFEDLKHQRHYTLSNLNLQSNHVSLNNAFPLTLTLNFNSTQPNMSGDLQFNSNVQFNLPTHTLTLNTLQFSTKLNGKNFPKNDLSIAVHTNAIINFQQQTLSLTQLSGRIDDLSFTGNMDGNTILDKPSFSGLLTIPQFNPQTWATKMGMKLPAMRDPNALSSATISTQFSWNNGVLNLTQLKMNLDKTSLSGTLSYQDAKTGTNKFDLTLNQINLANYMSPNNNNKQTPVATPTEAAAAATTVIPVQTLRKLNVGGQLKIGQLSIDQFQLNNFKMIINAKNGDISVKDTAALFQGQYQGNTHMNVKGNTPKIDIAENISNIQIAPLYDLLSKKSRFRISGTAILSANLHAQGADTNTLTKTLNGKVNLNVKDGVLKGIDLQHQLDIAAALINKRAPSSSQTANDQTPFESLAGTFPITNGVVNNKDLLLKSHALTANGSGVINLVQKTIDYQIKCTAIEGNVDPEILKIQQVAGGSIPIKISGTFANYKVTPDTSVIMKGVAAHYLGKNTDKIKEKVGEQLRGLGDKLKGFFN